MQASSSTTSSNGSSESNNNNNNNHSTFKKKNNKQLVERFLQTIKSDITQVNSIDYINGYMRHWHLYEEKKEGDGDEEEKEEEEQRLQQQRLLLLEGAGRKEINNNNKKTSSREKYSNIFYRYDWLLYGSDIQTIQDRIIQFVIDKKKEGRGASAIDNYINPLQKFYWVNGVKGIDWKLVRSYRPEHVKKTHDREYYPEEVIAIEDKLDIRGKVVMGLMRGSGVRRGAEPSINVGDIIPLQSRYGKIYKI
ncbi:MAG: hypothetical protein M3270_09440, partial [Thermoproteota archaeon]|nr:hypothetical protein [Thermoproteota archaeon]